MTSELFVLEMDGMEQSVLDPNDPTKLVFDYMRRIGDLFDSLPAGPLRVLHIGGAAMTLPRYVLATRPGSRQIVLEPANDVIALVDEVSPLPPNSGISVRPVTGQVGIREIGDASQDVVVLDAYAEGVVPEELLSVEFVSQVRRVLDVGGMFVANVADTMPLQRVRDFVPRISGLGNLVIGVEPATLEGGREGNVVVACGAVPVTDFGDPTGSEYLVFRGGTLTDVFG